MTNRLEALRREKGMAQRGLTALSGVSAGTISAVEKWGYRPAPDTQRRIAEALGVAVSDIWPEAAGEVSREPVAA